MDELSTDFLNSSIPNRIQAFVDNTVNYQIMKATGLYENALTRLRKHEAKPKNLALDTAIELDNLARMKYKSQISAKSNRDAKNLIPHIKKVLNSHLTSYHMSQESGINISVFSVPRSKSHSINNIRLQSALVLNQFYLHHKSEIKASMKRPTRITARMLKNAQNVINSRYSSYRLAKRIGVNPSVTSRLFRGQTKIKNASPRTIKKISDFYRQHKTDL